MSTTPEHIDPIVASLRNLVQAQPDLADAAFVYEQVLPLLRDADLHVSPLQFTAEQVQARWQAGLPLLHETALELDDTAACHLMAQLAYALETARPNVKPAKRRLAWRQNAKPDVAALYEHAAAGQDAVLRVTAARQIRLALQEGRLDGSGMILWAAAGEKALVTNAAQELLLDPGLAWTLAENGYKPAVRAVARQFATLIAASGWQKGSCLVCGALAGLGEMQGNEAAAHLRCIRCGADWAFHRLACTHCGNEDRKTLSFLYPDKAQEKYRVQVCDNCGGYLKIVGNYAPTPPEMLAVDDLATLHLDFIAQERGYAPKPKR